MKFFIYRAIIHICTLAVSTFACMALIKYLYGTSDLYWPLFYNSVYVVIPIIATINILGEIAFAIFTSKEEKESIFKIMAIRTVKFLTYLILALYFTITATNYQEKLFFGLLIVILFFIYAGVEFGYFRKNSI